MSLLLRWTNALEPGDGTSRGGGGGIDSSNGSAGAKAAAASDSADNDHGDAAASDKGVLVKAGLKAVRIVCTKTENNKGTTDAARHITAQRSTRAFANRRGLCVPSRSEC